MVGCRDENQNLEEECMEWNDEVFMEMLRQGTIRQGQFAALMRFESHLVWGRSTWFFFESYCGREIVFVRSEEEAAEFGHALDVIVGWPSIYSLAILEGLNNHEEVDVTTVGLTSPLTIDDFVYNWEQVDRLWYEIGSERSGAIADFAEENYGQKALDAQNIRRWLFPGRLEALNDFLEERDIGSVDLSEININGTRELTIDDLPSWPITEEDIRNDSMLITLITAQLLTNEEQNSISPENLVRAQQAAENE